MILKTLPEIKFPIYPLRSYDRLTDIYGVVKVYTIYKMYILDDRNLEGENLGERRLRIKKYKYPLRTSVSSVKDLLFSKNKTRVYIDDTGQIFKYHKVEKATLKYHKIAWLIPTGFGSTKVIVKGINTPFLMHEEIPPNFKYAGVLKLQGGYILYEVSTTKKKDSWRRV